MSRSILAYTTRFSVFLNLHIFFSYIYLVQKNLKLIQLQTLLAFFFYVSHSDWKIPFDESSAAALPHWKLLRKLLLLHCIFKSLWPSETSRNAVLMMSDLSRFSNWWYDSKAFSTSALRFRDKACSISSEFLRIGSHGGTSSIEQSSSKFSKSNFSAFFGIFWCFCCNSLQRQKHKIN